MILLNLFLFLGSFYFALQITDNFLSKINRKRKILEALELAKMVCPPLPADKEEKIDEIIGKAIEQ